MKIVNFETEKGKISFFKHGDYVLTSVETDAADTETQTEAFINTDGESELETLYNSRTVTVKGYIRAQNQIHLEKLRREMIRLINGKDTGKLTVKSVSGEYFAQSRPETLPTFGDVVQYMQSFICYFKIPSFYWNKISPRGNVRTLFLRIDKIDKNSTLADGLVFTERICEGNVQNNGDTVGDMIITIKQASAIARSRAHADDVLTVSNLTTGESMIINHTLTEGETIIIDTAKSSVKSIKDDTITNILHKLEGDFIKLAIGDNVIKADSENLNINMTIEYYDKLAGLGI